MYGSITYTDVINQVQANGWTIVKQSADSTTIEKQRLAPALLVIPLALIPVLGVILGLVIIAVRGKITITIERKLTTARVNTPTNAYDINKREDLDMFFSDYAYGGVGYTPVLVVGGVVSFLTVMFLQGPLV